ncbi:MAG: peptidylprolyl isomerase [Paracoccaceae bacterium]|nr:peptidylprolyl isomerase [Paracoccaceae bacterium]
MKLTTILFTLVLLLAPGLASAQSPFTPVIKVNGVGITQFEIEQRAKLLTALGLAESDDVMKQAKDELIDDQLRNFAARQMKLTVGEQEFQKGLEEYTARANLTPDQFYQELAKVGVYPETFNDFVRVGLLWRKVVIGKFQSKAFVSEAELDTAMELGTTVSGASLLLSEIVVPYTPETETQVVELLNRVRGSIRNAQDFSDAALTYSAAPDRADGGKMDWIPATNLAPDVSKMLLNMAVGQVTPPVKITGAYAIFMLRGIRDNRAVAAKTTAYDYATLLLPGGRSQETLKLARDIEARVDTCNDLLAEAQKFPENAWKRQVLPVAKVPRDIRKELENLDKFEISTKLTRGKGAKLVVLMLCGRVNSISEGDREQVRQALFSQRLEAFGKGYLQELRADAIITRK